VVVPEHRDSDGIAPASTRTLDHAADADVAGVSPQERIAAEFAERFATTHRPAGRRGILGPLQ